jgi:hypothetical protein
MRRVDDERLVRDQRFLGDERLAPHRPERLTLESLDLGRIRATAAFEVEVFPDRVVQQTHDR